jgi:hypothetical protein
MGNFIWGFHYAVKMNYNSFLSISILPWHLLVCRYDYGIFWFSMFSFSSDIFLVILTQLRDRVHILAVLK